MNENPDQTTLPARKRAPRILVVVNVFRPDLGGGVLFADLCDGLAERGFDVTVRCAYPYYPQWTDVSGQNGWRIRRENHDRLNVERFGIFIPSNPNSLVQRLVYEASFFFSLSRRRIRKHEFDAMLVFCPLVGAVAYAGWNARRSRTPLWLNVQDLSAQAAAAGGFGGPTKLLVRIQNALFRKATVWSTISKPMIESLRQIPHPVDDIKLVPNWMHASLAQLLSTATPRQAVPADRPIRLLYSGNIGGKQDLLAFCQWLATSSASFEMRIQGAGGRADEVRTWIEQTQDPRFSMGDLTDEAGLATKLAWADAYVITEKRDAGSSFVPSKLIPGMTSGAPILAVCDAQGPLGQEVGGHDIGFLASWDEPESLNRFFSIIRNEADTYTSWSQKAIHRGAFYHRDRGIDRCVAVLEGLIEGKQST
ncbi:MAG: glycosyltransferase [Rhodothermales bacterium]